MEKSDLTFPRCLSCLPNQGILVDSCGRCCSTVRASSLDDDMHWVPIVQLMSSIERKRLPSQHRGLTLFLHAHRTPLLPPAHPECSSSVATETPFSGGI